MKKTLFIVSLLLNASVNADLVTLDNNDLQQTVGQAGADLSLVLSLNHGKNPDGSSTNKLSDLCVAKPQQCHMGVGVNNRYANGSYIDRQGKAYNSNGTTSTANPLGEKLWLVFKGIQGTINIQQLGLDGADLLYTNKSGNSITKPSIQFTFKPEMPILIRNFGFEALSVEQDDNSSSTAGYWKMPSQGSGLNKVTNGKYDYSSGAPTGYSSSSFDSGRETGFTGMKMNGNLTMTGTIKMFACDATHPRC